MNFTQIEARFAVFQPLGNQPIGVPCFVTTESCSMRHIDIGVWDGNEWTTEFGLGDPVEWAPISVALDAWSAAHKPTT